MLCIFLYKNIIKKKKIKKKTNKWLCEELKIKWGIVGTRIIVSIFGKYVKKKM